MKFSRVGQQYRDFVVTKSLKIPELQCTLIELVHQPSGAQVMHIANEDPENLFCLSFRTLPSSSNGAAHILEHTVLCGSEKFPIKDPFFAMNRRSLNTFMNALTGTDFTCYPAATQVPKDFYNLLSVYLDAVFNPNLDRFSFLQEGHRFEFAVPTDSTTPLEFKGIVFNEMKGAMSSPTTRMHEAMSCALFPDLSYGYNSGGDPKDIPSLSYEELKEFHHKFYHPGRCLFFFYGNMPLQGHLDFIEEQTVRYVSKPVPPIILPLQKRFTERRYIESRYPVSPDEEQKAMVAFGWLTCHILEQADLLGLSILESILLATDASPLKMALLRSGLCKQVSSYLETDLAEPPFIINLRGCNPESAEPLEKLIFRVLHDIAEKGIPLEQIESVLHQLEFHRSEITGDNGPYGLSIFMRSALLKQHGASPEEGLKIHSLSEELRKRNLADPRYFPNLIHKYLLDNTHFVRLVMTPDPRLTTEEAEEEKERLAIIQQNLSEKEKDEIVKQAQELAEFQAKQGEEDQDVLPRVTMEDVAKTTRDFPLTQETAGVMQVFHHTTFTNGIIYADLIYNLPEIAEEDLPLVKLFAFLLPQMGCGGRSYAENLDFVQAHTGGVGLSLTFNLQAANPNEFSPSLYIRGKALHRKADRLFSLLYDMATSADFSDTERLREVLGKHFTALQSNLQQNALRYAINLSASGLDVASKIANDWYGLSYYHRVKSILENLEEELPLLVKKLHMLKESLLCLEDPHLVLTCDAAMYHELKQHAFYGLEDLPTKLSKPWKGNYSISMIEHQGRVIASPVAFIAKVLKTVPYTHPDAPVLNIAAFLCDNLVLHTKIREQGGAYGGGASCNAMAANFYFYSYRDPNISATLEAFKESIDEIAGGNFDEFDLEEAKLEMIQALDAPVSPGSRGDLAYGWLCEGKSRAIRQQFRNRVLELTREDIMTALQAHIQPYYDEGVTVAFANKTLLEKENEILATLDEPKLTLSSN